MADNSDPYRCTVELKTILRDHLRAIQPVSNTLPGICQLTELIEDIDRRERQERRNEAMTEELKRLWALLAPEYNELSGHDSMAWLEDPQERERALAALENRPTRLAKQGEFTVHSHER